MDCYKTLIIPKRAQQSVHPTSGSLRDLGAVFWLRVFSTSQTLSTPAHLRVPITAPVKSFPKNGFYKRQAESGRAARVSCSCGSFFWLYFCFIWERFAIPASLSICDGVEHALDFHFALASPPQTQKREQLLQPFDKLRARSAVPVFAWGVSPFYQNLSAGRRLVRMVRGRCPVPPCAPAFLRWRPPGAARSSSQSA